MELTTLTLCCDQSLRENDARLLRGFFGQRYKNRVEFHHHGPSGLLYQHPLIQYKAIGGVGRVMGLESGSFLVRALPVIDTLNLNGQTLNVLEQNRNTETIVFGATEAPVKYQFLSPWFALNQANHQRYNKLNNRAKRQDLLSRILIGNLNSLCKSVRLTITDRLKANLYIEKPKSIEIKSGVILTGFMGTFTVNFQLPPLWGIGKQSARGFGTVRQIKE
ncbi:MAG: hypothetical protein J4F29_18365 [Candidatus Latescibacteria bacterium]|nr:hypothetical protein [Candidatus Latescibacterota bacterium]